MSPAFPEVSQHLLLSFLICAPTLPINQPQFQGTDAILLAARVKSHRPVESLSLPHCAGGTVLQTPLLCTPRRHQPRYSPRSAHKRLLFIFLVCFCFTLGLLEVCAGLMIEVKAGFVDSSH